MGNLHVLSSHEIGVVAVRNPVSQGAATVTTGWVAMTDFQRMMTIIMVGTMSAGSTVDAKLEQATTAAGAGAKDITSKAITQLTQAGTDSDKQVIINLDHEDMDIDGGFDFARVSVTVGTAASLLAVVALGFPARYGPMNVRDLATVDEIIT